MVLPFARNGPTSHASHFRPRGHLIANERGTVGALFP